MIENKLGAVLVYFIRPPNSLKGRKYCKKANVCVCCQS